MRSVGFSATGVFRLSSKSPAVGNTTRMLAVLCVFALAIGVSPCLLGAAEPPAARLPKIRVAPDGRTFQTADGKPFVPMGVNYYRPGTGWAPQVWKKFDAEATRRDFAQMRQLGVNCVRVFLTFGSFLQQPDQLSAEGLDRFDQFLQIAEEAGIYVHPTGPDHWEGIPDWARGDRFLDRKLLAAQENFWRLLAERYRGRNVIFAYDLLNEPEIRWESRGMREEWNEFLRNKYASAEKNATAWGVPAERITWGNQSPPEPKENPDCPILLDYQLFREQLADRWVSRQVEAIKKADPDALVTVGLIQWSVPVVLPSVRQYSAFRPKRIAQWLDFLEIHFYPLAGQFYDYTRPEDEKLNLAYLHSVVREVAAAGKPVVVAEFGWYGGGRLTINRGVHPPATQQQQARWCRLVVQSTAGLAAGWLNWGLFDMPEARDVSQLTGLLTATGEPKAWAQEFQSLAEQYRQKGVVPVEIKAEPVFDWDRAIRSPKVGRQFLETYLRQMPPVAVQSP